MDTSWWLAVAAAVVLIAVAALADHRGRRPARRRPVPHGRLGPAPPGPLPQPRPGEVWWARTPYRDRPGTTVRRCVVLSAREETVVVAEISARRPEPPRPEVVLLPQGTVDDSRGMPLYLETDALVELPVWDFRRRCGRVSEGMWRTIRKVAG
ncbi:type II toxin-antitoxin system PemK/MazF family toxin [Streptomyces alkaliterrae]|uniref:Type II toxin-antitoxin system PemK/MazF family toxin n=1 Tax=Streptomyces alkaliterrae TaxID=2213162 RepID=A0A5P0YZ73_9ACTN|nr:type II toxin-antitoxin system PemK/MazF family toxin [Streptomyces alkaliterrae]MBB1256675.1 type II toxin-antitoxin system PemK/MazF family toxin [Streptomyces alkaliterrae]MBB1262302.1 type II toxin-antitoxin system PemK/MazF family toxin [Streptomyces alkaliterrae]MQS04857.1 type II toxin-antitoxin system PemK/MazF family toxin [Streptomyces alkaliterrae]